MESVPGGERVDEDPVSEGTVQIVGRVRRLDVAVDIEEHDALLRSFALGRECDKTDAWLEPPERIGRREEDPGLVDMGDDRRDVRWRRP